jgi:proteic killer suppression protein
MIKTFRDRNTFRLFRREHTAAFPEGLHRVMLRKLIALHAAAVLEDLRFPPGNRLEKLKGKRVGQHSIRVNDQWRLCFRWKDGDAFDVEIVDYH